MCVVADRSRSTLVPTSVDLLEEHLKSLVDKERPKIIAERDGGLLADNFYRPKSHTAERDLVVDQ